MPGPQQWTARSNLVLTLLARGCADAARLWIAQAGAPPEVLAAAWRRTRGRSAGATDAGCESNLEITTPIIALRQPLQKIAAA